MTPNGGDVNRHVSPVKVNVYHIVGEQLLSHESIPSNAPAQLAMLPTSSKEHSFGSSTANEKEGPMLKLV